MYWAPRPFGIKITHTFNLSILEDKEEYRLQFYSPAKSQRNHAQFDHPSRKTFSPTIQVYANRVGIVSNGCNVDKGIHSS